MDRRPPNRWTRRALLGALPAAIPAALPAALPMASRVGLSALGLGLGVGTASRAAAAGPVEPMWDADPAPLPLGVGPRALRFPADFGAHPETRIEWWYVTGWLGASMAAPTHGFQVTFFRAATGLAAGHPSAFAARQLLFAHAALTVLPTSAAQDPGDASSGRLVHDQRTARAGLGRAEARTGDTAVHLGDWSLRRQGQPSPAGGRASGAAAAAVASAPYRAEVHARDPQSGASAFRLALTLSPRAPLVLQGDAGLSRKGPRPAQASHYYSRPQMQVGAELAVAGGATQSLRGQAWLDHEWSDSVLDPEAVGWDWVGFNLADGSALTAFRLRRADGSALWAGGSLSARGDTRPFGPEAVRFTPLRSWTSPLTGARYPVEWQLDTPAGRHRVRALLDAQELDSRASTGSAYWEGLSELLDAGGQRIGLGYLEMTGYAGRLAMP
jgi:predicted secreted hydrolase